MVPTAHLNLGIEAPESAGSRSSHFKDYIPNVATDDGPQNTQGSCDAGAGEEIILDPLRRENEDTDLAINLLDLQTSQKFLDRLRTAFLKDTAMDPEDISTLRNPEAGFDLLDPSPLLCSIQHSLIMQACIDIIMMAFETLRDITIPMIQCYHLIRSNIAFDGSQALFRLNMTCAPIFVWLTLGHMMNLIGVHTTLLLVTFQRQEILKSAF